MNNLIAHTPSILQPDNDTVDAASLWDTLRANRLRIVATMLAVMLVGAAVLIVTKPVFEANILVQVEDANTLVNPNTVPGRTFDLKAAIQSEIEVIKSRRVLARTVDRMQLFIEAQPKRFPLIGDWVARHMPDELAAKLPEFGGYAWGKEQIKIGAFDVPDRLQGKRFVVTAIDSNQYRLYQDDDGIDAVGQVGVPLHVKAPDGVIDIMVDRLAARPGTQFMLKRDNAVETVDKLRKALVISERGKQSDVIGVSYEHSDPRHASAVLNALGDEYLRQNVERKAAEAEESLAFLNQKLPELKAQMEQSESRYNALRRGHGTVDLAEETKSLLQRSVELETRLSQMRQKRETLQEKYQSEHPEMLSADRQIRSLEAEVANVHAKLKALPAIEQDVFTASRDLKVNTELYTSLLASAQQLRIAGANKVASVRMLDHAVVPVKPVKPRPALILGAAALGGLLLGIGAALFRRNWSARVEDPDQIESLVGLPVSATIPHSKDLAQLQRRKDGAKLLATEAHAPQVIESLRGFRAALQYATRDSRNNIILITGPTPGVGKTFLSANFATVLASIGKRVLLIDADLRAGHLDRYYGQKGAVGLAEVVSGKLPLHQVIQHSAAENVDFLSAGSADTRAAELLGHAGFGRLLREASEHYDYVLVDTAPVLSVADALTVAEHAGSIFNVVRGGVSTKHEIEEAVRRFNVAGYAVTGVVFNDYKPRLSRYGYGMLYEGYSYT
ncbi:polysaccharide biosynthesis tyrosine autokinase [Oxalobacteraceae bacterium OM1]|nr:polysaccharide biosynthesis tyrosine autokinase [Oxalobacteraceae bacterium OM1]